MSTYTTAPKRAEKQRNLSWIHATASAQAVAERTALVMSGGGAKGAFSVGVIAEIYDRYRERGWFSIVGGASTGGIIAPFAALLAGPRNMADEVLEALVDAYTTVTTSDLLDKRKWFDLLFHHDSLNASSPLRSMLETRLKPSWFAWLQTTDAPECYVLYTNFRTGEKIAASPRDPGMTRKSFIDAIVASASVPGLMDATFIDGDACYDGCLRDLLPLEHAIELGATTILPILLEPDSFQESEAKCDRLDRVLSRAFAILVDEVGKSDLEIARNVTQGVQIREALMHIDHTLASTRQSRSVRKARRSIADLVSRSDLQPLIGSTSRARRIIDGIRPGYQLSEDWLNFDPRQMKIWLAHGRSIAESVIRESPF